MSVAQLLTTKAFWLTLLDVVAALLNLLGKQFWPNQVDTVWQVWLILQPLAALIIGALAVDEIAVPILRMKLF